MSDTNEKKDILNIDDIPSNLAAMKNIAGHPHCATNINMSSDNEKSLVGSERPATIVISDNYTGIERRSDVDLYARIMLNAAPVICTLWDIYGNLLDYNQEASNVLGLTVKSKSEYIEQFCNRPPEYQPNGKSSRSEMQRIIREVLETGYQRYEWMACTEGGKPLPLETSAVLVSWKGNYRIVCYSRDLREIKQLEEQTQEAEKRSKLLLDTMPLGTSLWDQEGNIIDCNEENMRMHGITDKADLLSKYFDVTCPKFQADGTASKDKAVANIRKAFETGYLKYEWTSCTATGQTFPTEKTLIRIPWKGGWCVASYTYDLREREARLEAEEIARVLLDTSPMGTTLWDPELNLIDCNHETLRMFGMFSRAEKAEFMRNFFELNPQLQSDGTPSGKKAIAHLRKAFETGYEKFEWMHLTSSGESFPAEVTMIRIPWKDSWRVATYTRDLREAKVHEREMRETLEYVNSIEIASKAAQITSQAKSEFLAKMSHELRTPLNAAIGFLGLELQKKLSQESVDNLEISLDACHTLLHLINDILDISKIEAGHFELMNQDYHLVDLINETVSLNSFRLMDNSFKSHSSPLAFHLEVDENLPSQLCGDNLRIKQVLNNLLSNAFKYTGKGVVTLSIGLESGEEEKADSTSIRFSVRDTGRGIKTENLRAIFNSYTRFGREGNKYIEGVGLGLAISKNLVEMMGGRMHVKSEYGKGSTFSCIIPQAVIDPTPLGHETADNLANFRDAPKQYKNKYPNSQQSVHLPYAKVLVVDDVQTNLRLTRSMLQQYDIEVDCVTSGQQAVDLLRSGKNRYNAIFMDHMMPGMDGIQSLHLIRAIDSDYARSVPVIVLTANVISGNETMFLEQGFQAFLAKPIDPLQLDAILKKWVKSVQQEAHLNSLRQQSQVLRHSSVSSGQAVEPAIAHAVEGLDIEEALWRFGSEQVFLDVLRSFAANMPQLLKQMQRIVETDLDGYAIIVHGLKGASYGVGANALGDMAKDLEYAAKNNDRCKIREKFPLFLETAEKLLLGINGLLDELMPEPVAKENKPLKPAPDAGELAALHQASLACAYSAMEEHLQKLEQYQYQAGEELIIWLRERMEAFDYALINERLAEYAY